MAAQRKEVNFVTTSHFAALAAALAFSMAAVSVQAAATDTPAPAVVPATQPAPLRAASNDHDPNRVICKHEEEIGTRLGGSKVCHTHAEWDQIGHNGGNLVNALQAAASHSNPNGN